MEFVLGGVAACGAGFFTNPLEVVKTRMQLQGELRARGQYAVHYRNVFHAFFAIARHDGILTLQRGLVPALWYQLLMNGARLGTYQCFVNMGFTKNKDGQTSVARSLLAGSCSGCVGSVFGSPIYMVKTQLQSMSSSSIAVGHQYHHTSMTGAFRSVFKEHGVKGLWRGVSGAIPRVMVGSASQLATFSASTEYIASLQIFAKDSIWQTLTASMFSGMVVTVCMTPFDVISTRLYNQPADAKGKGTLYRGVVDCFRKVLVKEGFFGLYKGVGAVYFRLGPHTVLSLVFWSELRKWYLKRSATVQN